MENDVCRGCEKHYVGCKGACMTLALADKKNSGHKLALFLDKKAKEADLSAAEFVQRAAERKKLEEKNKFARQRAIILAKAKQKKEYYAKNRERILAKQKEYVKREREILERLKVERKKKEV